MSIHNETNSPTKNHHSACVCVQVSVEKSFSTSASYSPHRKPHDLPGLSGVCSSPSGNTSTSFQNMHSRLTGRCSATKDGRSRGAHAALLEETDHSEWATVQSQTGRTHTMRMTDLSSCWWKCWTFIWWAVLFLSRLNLRRLKKERHQDYKRLFSTHRNKLVVFTWPSTMNGLHFFDWPKGSHRPALKHYRLLPINLMVRSYCWRHHILIKYGEKELVLNLKLQPYWLLKRCTIKTTGGDKAIISLNKLRTLWQQWCPAYKIQPLVQ